MNWKPYLTIAIASFLSHSAGTDALAQKVMQSGAVTIQVPSKVSANTIDYVNAKPMNLPKTSAAPADLIRALTSQSPSLGTPGSAIGGAGNGKLAPVWLGIPTSAADDEIASQEFGTSNHPFSTARADLSIATNTAYPYGASGKLFFNIGTSTFVCSASLIKRGLVVTAAHCVANFGKSQFYTNFRFVPGYRSGLAPFGVWTGGAIVMTSYFNGTDPCFVSGVVCANDVAVIRLTSQAAYPGAIAYPGTSTSWYGYGWNGYGFTAAKLTHITQIGYPVCLDNGQLMERNDSQGFTNAAQVNNTIIGSLMCGGSSGGPWLVNFGIRPVLTSTTAGTASLANIVVGTTSWGYTNNAIKEQGASPFTSGNIVPLINAACGSPISQPACL
jgi:V8-like Glu-specific endopeptidase